MKTNSWLHSELHSRLYSYTQQTGFPSGSVSDVFPTKNFALNCRVPRSGNVDNVGKNELPPAENRATDCARRAEPLHRGDVRRPLGGELHSHSERSLVADLLLDPLDAALQSDDLLVNRRLFTLQGRQLLLQPCVLRLLQVHLDAKLFLHALEVGLEIALDVVQLRLQRVRGRDVLRLDGLKLILLHSDFFVLALQGKRKVLELPLQPRRSGRKHGRVVAGGIHGASGKRSSG